MVFAASQSWKMVYDVFPAKSHKDRFAVRNIYPSYRRSNGEGRVFSKSIPGVPAQEKQSSVPPIFR
jgi:hypothetical protein